MKLYFMLYSMLYSGSTARRPRRPSPPGPRLGRRRREARPGPPRPGPSGRGCLRGRSRRGIGEDRGARLGLVCVQGAAVHLIEDEHAGFLVQELDCLIFNSFHYDVDLKEVRRSASLPRWRRSSSPPVRRMAEPRLRLIISENTL